MLRRAGPATHGTLATILAADVISTLAWRPEDKSGKFDLTRVFRRIFTIFALPDRLIARNPAVALQPGARLGPYEVLSAIGAGGMGEVYRARDTKLGRDVAIKLLSDLFASTGPRLGRPASHDITLDRTAPSPLPDKGSEAPAP